MNSIMYKKTFFDYINNLIMILVLLITLAPFWFTLVGSFNEGIDYMRGGVFFFVRKFTLANYVAALSDKTIIHAFGVTAARTFFGTITHILFTFTIAYALSQKELKGNKTYRIILIITMFFGLSVIPNYILFKKLGLINNFLVYIIPTLFSVWDMVIMLSFIKTIPDSIIEATRIDGASEYQILYIIIIPLSVSVLAAIALFCGVSHWNSYFDSMMYTTSYSLQTAQYYLMRIITQFNIAAGIGANASSNIPQHALKISPETIKLAMMMVTVGPILLLYPFLQKYFIKGMYVGSIKE